MDYCAAPRFFNVELPSGRLQVAQKFHLIAAAQRIDSATLFRISSPSCNNVAQPIHEAVNV